MMEEQQARWSRRVGADGVPLFTQDDEALPWNIEFEVVGLKSGGLHLVGLTLSRRPGFSITDASITHESLRRLPLRRLMEVAVAEAEGDGTEALSRWKRTESNDPDHLHAVAEVYRQAASFGRGLTGGPRGAVRDHWRVSAKTADRWIRAAREAGTLEPWRDQTGKRKSQGNEETK